MTNHDVLDNTVCDIGDCSEKRGCILARARAGVLGPGSREIVASSTLMMHILVPTRNPDIINGH